MRIDPDAKLFFGVRIDSKLRDTLERCPPGDRSYYDHPEHLYLRVLRSGDDQYLGKIVDGGLHTDRIDDVRRNVISILQRLAPATRAPESLIILGVADGDGEGFIPRRPVNRDDG
jgi:hypothetical protein